MENFFQNDIEKDHQYTVKAVEDILKCSSGLRHIESSSA